LTSLLHVTNDGKHNLDPQEDNWSHSTLFTDARMNDLAELYFRMDMAAERKWQRKSWEASMLAPESEMAPTQSSQRFL